MGTNSREYSRQYYKAHKEHLAAYQREYHRKRVAQKKTNIVLEDTAFNLSFQGSLKNIETMYNSLLKKYQDLLEAYNNMKQGIANREYDVKEDLKEKLKKFLNL